MFITPGSRMKAGGKSFPTGTLLLFQQSTAPLGWVKQATHNDKTLRVVSGAASSGGATAFSTFAAQTPSSSVTIGATTITNATSPSHTHTITADSTTGGGSSYLSKQGSAGGDSVTSNGSGSDGSHTHSATYTPGFNLNLQYVDVIIAKKS